MSDLALNIVEPTVGFQIRDRMMRYNLFVPRLYNWCKSLGFEPGKIMPSRAFCSDESQGYPIIMIAKHFGTFPFNHGRVGGIVASDRHGPHAAHGQDLLIIQASHVGYDPETKTFGIYRRAQTTHGECSSNCGKIHNVISWYKNEYLFAQQNILLHNDNGKKIIIVDNQLLRSDRNIGLFLHLDKFITPNSEGHRFPLNVLSTAKVFAPAEDLIDRIGEASFNGITPNPIGTKLVADMFYFQRDIPPMEEKARRLEINLIDLMPQIVTSTSPILTAAEINSQTEFDRIYRTIVKEQGYKGKKVLFIAGLNIDISPSGNQLFPSTMFVPWAAYVQDHDGFYYTLEQEELVQLLEQQDSENPDEINLEDAIEIMTRTEEVKVELS
ncbi:MAG: hypothetical protein EP297_10415 [Gammaproteobacteria bacterium]|nr:MAG: hypothetical protein EP297_10415 [Gammaproteobacteria bacterium]